MSSNVPSLPIPIQGSRRRSGSLSDSSSDSDSASPASPVQSPASGTLPRIAPISPPSTSPILYFMSQSPTSPSTFPFRRGMPGSIFSEDDPSDTAENPIAKHARRASTSVWPGPERLVGQSVISPPAVPRVPGPQQDRAAGLLRRLSLGGNMRPTVPLPRQMNGLIQPGAKVPRSTTPPGMSAKPSNAAATPRKGRRATMSPGTPRRAPSPMGERILKGHFDGFN